jgi:hypothetical protein
MKEKLVALQNQLNNISKKSDSRSMSPPVFSSREQAAKSQPFQDVLKSDKPIISEADLTEKVNSIVMEAVEKELAKIFNT